jgi:hypothetical protein
MQSSDFTVGRGGSRTFVAVVLVAGVLLLALGWVTATAAAEQPARAPDDLESPEGVVYRWLQHHRAGEIEEALALWDEHSPMAGSRETYEASPVGSFAPSAEQERMLIERLSVEPGLARVKVVSTRFTPYFQLSAPRPRQRSSVLTLTDERGPWRIVGVDAWPSFDRPRSRS